MVGRWSCCTSWVWGSVPWDTWLGWTPPIMRFKSWAERKREGVPVRWDFQRHRLVKMQKWCVVPRFVVWFQGCIRVVNGVLFQIFLQIADGLKNERGENGLTIRVVHRPGFLVKSHQAPSLNVQKLWRFFQLARAVVLVVLVSVMPSDQTTKES